MGNKVDKQEDRQITKETAEAWCKEHGDIPFFETSAIANTCVDEAFLAMVKKALDNQAADDMQMPDTIGGMGGGNI